MARFGHVLLPLRLLLTSSLVAAGDDSESKTLLQNTKIISSSSLEAGRVQLVMDAERNRLLAKADPKQAKEMMKEHFKELSGGSDAVTMESLKQAYVDIPDDTFCVKHKVTDESLQKMISERDEDGDGKVTEAEFENYLASTDFMVDKMDHAYTVLSIDACEKMDAQHNADIRADAESKKAVKREAEDLASFGEHDQSEGHGDEAECIKKADEWNKPVDEEVDEELIEMLTEAEKTAIDAAKAKSKGVDLVQTENFLRPAAAAIDAALAAFPAARGSFSATRLVSPTNCGSGRGICTQWGDDCVDWVDTSANQCQGWSHSSTKHCNAWTETTTKSCGSFFSGWWSWLCAAWNYVTTSSCSGWRTVTSKSCTGYRWVASGFCRLTERVCKANECLVDWQYLFDQFGVSGLQLGLAEESSQVVAAIDAEADVAIESTAEASTGTAASTVADIQEAISMLTGGKMFGDKHVNAARATAFQTLKNDLEHCLNRVKTTIENGAALVHPSILANQIKTSCSHLRLPAVLQNDAKNMYDMAARHAPANTLSLLQSNESRGEAEAGSCLCNGCWAITLSASLTIFGQTITAGVAVGGKDFGALGGAWWEVTLLSALQIPDVTPVGFTIDFGIWKRFDQIAGQSVFGGVSVDAGAFGVAATILSAGSSALLTQLGLTFGIVQTVPGDTPCAQGGWGEPALINLEGSQNCHDLRSGAHRRDPQNGAMSGGRQICGKSAEFAAFVISGGWGVSFSPLSYDLSGACCMATWVDENADCWGQWDKAPSDYRDGGPFALR